MAMADIDSGGDPPIIINEVLCYVQNKIDILHVDLIVQLCEENFDKSSIEKAKELLFNLCHSESDRTVMKSRTGEHKSDRNLRDIYNLLQEKGKNTPIFCAKNINILPPVTIKSVDVSLLLHTIKQLQVEVNLLSAASVAQRDLTDGISKLTRSLDDRVTKIETPKVVSEGITSPVAPVVVAKPVASEGTTTPDASPAAAAGGDGTPLNPNAPPFTAPVAVPRRSYLNVAQANTGGNPGSNVLRDADGFTIVGRNGRPVKSVSTLPAAKKKSPKQGMVGSSTRSNISAATRYVKASVFVTRYPPGTTAVDVKEDLLLDERVKDLDIKVEQVQTKYDTYTSFHVTCVCKEPDAKIFLGPDLWPRDILYRQWKENRTVNARGPNNSNLRVHNNAVRPRNAGHPNDLTHRRNGYNRLRRDSV